MEETLDGWFKREILAHDAMLLRYLLRVWRRKDEVHDLRQEMGRYFYVRLSKKIF
jgi:hypothetical protein